MSLWNDLVKEYGVLTSLKGFEITALYNKPFGSFFPYY